MQSPRDSEVGRLRPGMETRVDRVDLDSSHLAILQGASPGRFSKIHVTILVLKDHVIVVRLKLDESGKAKKVENSRK